MRKQVAELFIRYLDASTDTKGGVELADDVDDTGTIAVLTASLRLKHY